MIQADEGPFPARYRADEWGFQWRDATDAELEEKFGILFAMRVPGADLEADGLHDAHHRRSTRSASSSTPASGPISPCSPIASGPTRTSRHFYDFFEITDRLTR